MIVDLTDKEIEHIYFMCKSDLEDGERAIKHNPKASILHREWLKCFEVDRSIMYKINYVEQKDGE